MTLYDEFIDSFNQQLNSALSKFNTEKSIDRIELCQSRKISFEKTETKVPADLYQKHEKSLDDNVFWFPTHVSGSIKALLQNKIR